MGDKNHKPAKKAHTQKKNVSARSFIFVSLFFSFALCIFLATFNFYTLPFKTPVHFCKSAFLQNTNKKKSLESIKISVILLVLRRRTQDLHAYDRLSHVHLTLIPNGQLSSPLVCANQQRPLPSSIAMAHATILHPTNISLWKSGANHGPLPRLIYMNWLLGLLSRVF